METMSIRTRTCVLGALALVAFALAPSFASDPAKPKIATADEAADEHAEMERLIGKVELRLREIDRLLDDASAGDAASLAKIASGEAKAGLAAIDELLKQSHAGARQVVTDIDRILELSSHTHPGGT
jgi:hypothetical protein